MYDPPKSDAVVPSRQTSEEARIGTFIEPMRLWHATRGASRLIATTVVSFGALGAVSGRTLIPKEYVSSTSLLVTLGGAPEELARFAKTQSESIKSPPVLDSARDRLGSAMSLEQMGRAVSVELVADSNLIHLRGRSPSPEGAVALTSAVADTFIGMRVSLARQRLERDLERLDADLAKARTGVNAARGALDVFRSETGTTDPLGEAQAAMIQSERLRAEADSARAMADGESARVGYLSKAVRTEPVSVVIGEQHIRPEAAKLAETRALLAAESKRLSPEHPRIRALMAQASALEQSETIARSTVAATTVGPNPNHEVIKQRLSIGNSERTASEKRAESLHRMADDAKRRAEKRLELHNRASELQRDLRTVETHLGDLEMKRLKLADDVNNPQAGLIVASPPQLPLRPDKPTGRIVALVSPVVGVLLSLITVIARTVRGLRVVTAPELAYWGRAPVVAACAGASEEASQSLAEDLGAELRGRVGRTLVVTWVDEDLAFARRVVACVIENEMAPDATSGDSGGTISVVALSQSVSSVRRAARLADRVIVLARSKHISVPSLLRLRTQLGIEQLVFALFDVPNEYSGSPDRVGKAESIWGHIQAMHRTMQYEEKCA